jgi:hypothetical protein
VDIGELAGRDSDSEVTDSAALPDGFRVYRPMAGGTSRRSSTAPSPSPAELLGRLGQRDGDLRFGPGEPMRHRVAHHEHRPVGATTSFLFGDAVLLVRCLVVPEFVAAASGRR